MICDEKRQSNIFIFAHKNFRRMAFHSKKISHQTHNSTFNQIFTMRTGEGYECNLNDLSLVNIHFGETLTCNFSEIEIVAKVARESYSTGRFKRDDGACSFQTTIEIVLTKKITFTAFKNLHCCPSWLIAVEQILGILTI